MSETKIEVQPRQETGSNASRRLRGAGAIPAVIYGGGKEPMPIEVDRKTVVNLLRDSGGENAVFLLALAGTGQSRHVMTREISVDAVTRQVLHIDFQRVDMQKKVRVQVQIELEGVPEGVKNEGGVLDFISREVEIECLPADIPNHLMLDVSSLEVGQHKTAGDIELAPRIELLEDAERVIVAVAHSRVAAEVEAAEAEAEAAGELLIEAEPDEPEVIGRVREDGDTEDGAGSD